MNARKILIVSLCILLLASVAIIACDWYFWKDYKEDRIKAFQRYVCGLGLGASVNPRWGFINFDPRVDPIDETGLFPIPGNYSYSPGRGLYVSDIKEITLALPSASGDERRN